MLDKVGDENCLKMALLAEFLYLVVVKKWKPNLLHMLEKTDTPSSVEQGRKCTILLTSRIGMMDFVPLQNYALCRAIH